MPDLSIISLLVYDRPDYTRAALAALAQCHGIAGWRLLVYSHTWSYPETLAATRSFDACPVTVCVGPEQGGHPYARVSHATYALLELAFGLSDYVVHLEHDDVLAPDALTWFAWARDTYRDDVDVFTVGGFAHTRQTKPSLQPHFLPWGWATWRDRWHEMRADWSFDFWDRRLNEVTRGRR